MLTNITHMKLTPFGSGKKHTKILILLLLKLDMAFANTRNILTVKWLKSNTKESMEVWPVCMQ